MTEFEGAAPKKHIKLGRFLLVWLAIGFTGLFLYGFIYGVTTGETLGRSLSAGIAMPVVLFPLLIPAVLIGLLLYLIYWLIWGKKQKAAWTAVHDSDEEKARLYDQMMEGEDGES